jgi:ActD protein
MSETRPAAGTGLYGLMAEFRDTGAVVAAARRAREAGYEKIDAYTPFPIEELSEALGWRTRGRLPKLVLIGGLVGAAAGYGLQYYASVIAYPVNVGGRPLHSWPSFIPITFETAILFAALTAVLGMLALNGLPRPYHPVFNAPNFALASSDRFFLCIESADPRFDPEQTRAFLESVGAIGVSNVAY